MQFEWDENKNRSNIQKHGISFVTAIEVFFSVRLTAEDDRRDYGETRWLTVGEIASGTVIVAVYICRGQRFRIISARKVNERERRRYYEQIQKQ